VDARLKPTRQNAYTLPHFHRSIKYFPPPPVFLYRTNYKFKPKWIMEVLKTIKKVGDRLYGLYSKGFDTVFDVLFGSFSADKMMSMYCNEAYYMTPGGVIRREE
jgi:hypothetical protein